MTAYAAWAAPLVQGDPADPYRGLGPALPTELQWEALAGSEADGQAVPQATAFNHASTRWARWSPPSTTGCSGMPKRPLAWVARCRLRW